VAPVERRRADFLAVRFADFFVVFLADFLDVFRAALRLAPPFRAPLRAVFRVLLRVPLRAAFRPRAAPPRRAVFRPAFRPEDFRLVDAPDRFFAIINLPPAQDNAGPDPA
jgi:hypothetical protein